MKFFLIGFGQAGGKVVDLFVEYDKRTGQNSIARSLAINTAKSDLMGLKNIPMEDRLLVGQSIVKGHGVGADNETGAKIATDEIYTIQSAIDKRGTHQVDGFLIVAGLGGGTGSGGAPVLARRLKTLYNEPVYGLGFLPAREEGGLYSLNAARSFMTLVKEVDNLFLFDNDLWKKEGETLEDAYNHMNDEIVRRFGVLISAGERTKRGDVGQLVVDASEIINTLKGGGISVIGYASEEVQSHSRGFLAKLFRRRKATINTLDATTRIMSLVRRAVMGRLTVQCDIRTAEKALVLMAGAPDELNKKGMDKAKVFVEDLIDGTEVRGGDYPIPGSKHVAVVVLLSGISDIPRIKELQRIAIEAQDNIEGLVAKSGKKYDELMDTDDSLKPLF
ncbi:MAG: tubulin/FtsZ family protein [Methanosarcinales archaeon Met12]|nr:MAG: tubulin/FtsZ family protein [Methanosarcinales archaeon Met12]